MLGSSVRTRGNYWWPWIGGGSSGFKEWHWIAAATELAGDEEEGTFPGSVRARAKRALWDLLDEMPGRSRARG